MYIADADADEDADADADTDTDADTDADADADASVSAEHIEHSKYSRTNIIIIERKPCNLYLQ